MPTPEYNVDIDLGEPPPDLQEYARVQCGEDPNSRLQAIYELRDMIYERGECTPQRMDDEYLLRFYEHATLSHKEHTDWYVFEGKTGFIMVNYYQFKEDNSELFENVYPLDLRRIGDSHIVAVPPYRDQCGRRLLLFRLGCWDPKTVSVEDLFRATIFILEMGLLEQRTQILGGVALFDLEELGTQHVWQVTPSVAVKIVKLLVSSFPTTTHAIHVINHSWIFDKIFNMFKPLLTPEMRSRIHFHGYDVTSLHKHIQPEYLPERYGGIWPEYPYTIWLESLKKNFTVAKEVLAMGYKFREEEVCPEVVTKLKQEGIKLY